MIAYNIQVIKKRDRVTAKGDRAIGYFIVAIAKGDRVICYLIPEMIKGEITMIKVERAMVSFIDGTRGRKGRMLIKRSI